MANNTETQTDSSSGSSECFEGEFKIYREFIRPPVAGDSLAYEVCMDKPVFNIANGYLSVVPGSYTYDFPNSVTLLADDRIEIILRIPRQILMCKYGYMIPTNAFKNGPVFFLTGTIKINASNDTLIINAIVDLNNNLPDIVEFSFRSGRLPRTLIDICSITYSFTFLPVKLVPLYVKCHEHRHKCGCGCRKPVKSVDLEVENVITLVTPRIV
jgi:hypothetical protein